MRFAIVTGLAVASGVAMADPLTIELPVAATAERSTTVYSCGEGRKVTAEYVNAGDNALALVDTGEGAILMVNVISASGARYAGRQYVWWTKGDTADFYDLTRGGDAAPEFSCQAE